MKTFRQPFRNEWPITQYYGETITSPFHTGIDYGCPEQTEILASGDGTVMFAGRDSSGYGKYVIIQHDSERSTLYAHLFKVFVIIGQKVTQGQVIGLSGNTGNSTGPHLHFEARKIWNNSKSYFDPMQLPLMSYDDNTNSPSKWNTKLTGAKELQPGEVQVVAPSGVFVHDSEFSNKEAYPYGSKFVFTGKTKEHNGLDFCECTVWIAANDGETQILQNVSKAE